MPEALKKEEVDSKTDPSVAKQYDDETPKDDQWKEFYKFVDSEKLTMMNTYRNGVGPVGRAMALAKRDGPDLLFLANKHGKKFDDLEQNKEINITIADNTGQGWASITGVAATVSNDDPRIKELYQPTMSAWFGDLKDGVHDGTYKDPRMALIEVKSNYIVHWKKTVGMLGFMKEVGQASYMGTVAQTGLTREFQKNEIEAQRT